MEAHGGAIVNIGRGHVELGNAGMAHNGRGARRAW
jgi:hypothetical protein